MIIHHNIPRIMSSPRFAAFQMTPAAEDARQLVLGNRPGQLFAFETNAAQQDAALMNPFKQYPQDRASYGTLTVYFNPDAGPEEVLSYTPLVPPGKLMRYRWAPMTTPEHFNAAEQIFRQLPDAQQALRQQLLGALEAQRTHYAEQDRIHGLQGRAGLDRLDAEVCKTMGQLAVKLRTQPLSQLRTTCNVLKTNPGRTQITLQSWVPLLKDLQKTVQALLDLNDQYPKLP